MYYNNSKINVTDGVVIYIKNLIKENTEILKQGRLCILNSTIEIKNKNKLLISALYRAHDLPKAEFTSELMKFLEGKINVKNHILIGDFNIDLLKLDYLSHEYLNNLLEKGFLPGFQTITRPSDFNSNIGSCIDNIFIKTSSIDTIPFKLSNLFNDHYPLFLSINLFKHTENTHSLYTIDYNKLNIIANNLNWSSILLMNDPNIATNSLISHIQKCIDQTKFVKIKTKHKSNFVPRSKWITNAIITSCNKKDLLYQFWKKNSNNNLAKAEYKNYVKILDKVIINAKLMYDRDIIKSFSNNSRKLWNFVNEKLGSKVKKNDDISYVYSESRQKIKDPYIISNTMNSFFTNIGSKLSNNILKPTNLVLTLPPINPKTIFLSPTDTYEIIDILKNMKMKCGGIDNINMKTIKFLSDHIVLPLVHIINLSIEKSIWPDALKCADIIPVFKANDRHIVSNYRPISLISNLAKIFEKIIYHRILVFVNKAKILSKKQYGFMKNIGTKNALNDVTNLIYEKLDKSTPIAVTFLDLAKAFDTVNHQILLDKLFNYGIRGNAHKLITSYLQNRKQRVRVNGLVSDFCVVNTGVPQGTIFGPLFFILYINDLLISMPDNVIFSFADDTAVISTEKTWPLVEQNLNRYLDKIYNWLSLNQLSLNVDKTVYMTFGNYFNSVPSNFNIFINGNRLKRVEKFKYLGIIFDCRMRWEDHIKFILNKTKYLVFIFRKISKIMLSDTLRIIYYALFHSIISYGIISWGGVYSSNLNLLQKQQNRLLKIVNKNHSSTDTNPLNLNQLFAFESLNFHYNYLKDKYLNSKSITRKKSILLPKRCKTISCKNGFIKAINIFNKLPDDLKSINNTIARKSKLKRWVSENI